MRIIAKRAFQFVDWAIFPENGELTAKVKRSFTVKPSSLPQEVPDWVKEADTFEQAVKDRNVTVVQ